MKNRGRYGHFIQWILIFIDFIVLNASYTIASYACGLQHTLFFSRVAWVFINITFAIVIYILGSLHNKRVVYIDRVLIHLVKYVLLHATLFLMLISFINALPAWSHVLTFYLLFFFLLSLWWIVARKVLKWFRARGRNYKQIIIIGGSNSGAGIRLLQELDSDAGYGYKIVGFFDNKNDKNIATYKGPISAVKGFIEENLVDEIYCAIPENEKNEVQAILNLAERHAINFYYVPQLSKYISRRFEFEMVGTVPVMSVHPHPLNNPFNRAIKRAFDLVVSAIVLIFSPLVFIPIAIGIKLSSPGPVLFKQLRTGYRGKSFYCYKFRSMRVNDESDTLQATENDSRKTKFGNFLRRTSLDELPQFINVFKGDMSIVGPRPHMIQQTQEYSQLIEKYMLRHIIKPGITGWAQVNGFRGPTQELWKMEKRVELDVWYAENWNFILDIKIIILTIFNALKGEKNAV